MSSAPAYVSYSSAYYRFPAARPMEKKEWLGGDLVFDIDADELKPGKGQECTHSAGWVCEKCMERAKEETNQLIEEFLVPDFGFKKTDMRVFFSGNRGYHVHVAGAEVYTLDKQARKEMIDYMTGADLDTDAVWDNLLRGLPGGWASRVARARRAEMEAGDSPDKAQLLEDADAGRWDNQRGAKQKLKSWIEKKRLHLGSEFDKSVTLDTSKLIRLPTTLHGGTGLLCMEVKSLDSFDPFSDPVVFSDNPVKIIADKDTPEFTLKGQNFSLKGAAELPEYAAIYLLCKKRATVMQ